MRLVHLLFLVFLGNLAAAQDIGLQLYSLRNELAKDLEASLDSIQAWDIHYVEDGNDGTYGLPFDEYKKMLEDREIEMVSVSAPYKELKKSPADVAARANAYGAKFAVCFWIPHADTLLTKKETRKAIKTFNRAGKVLAKAGVTLLYHPHGYEFDAHPKGGTMLDQLVLQSTNFDFEMDLYWIELPGENPVEWMQRYPKEFRLLHLKDCQKGIPHTLPNNADVEWNVVLGTGQFDIDGVIREGVKQGIPYMFIENESSKVLDQISPSADFVRKSLKEG